MNNSEIRNFSIDVKLKIYMHYYIKQLSLIHFPMEFSLDTRFDINSNAIKYPTLGVYTLKCFDNLKIKSFEDFCNEKDDCISSGLLGYYYRFADEIFV